MTTARASSSGDALCFQNEYSEVVWHYHAILQASIWIVGRLVQQLAVLREAIAEQDKHLRELSQAHPDPIFASFPSAGPVMVPRLIAALGSQRDRYQTASQIQC
jgi:hypothetical protein